LRQEFGPPRRIALPRVAPISGVRQEQKGPETANYCLEGRAPGRGELRVRRLIDISDPEEWLRPEQVGGVVRWSSGPCRVLGMYVVGRKPDEDGHGGCGLCQLCVVEDVPHDQVPAWYAVQTRPGKEVSAELTLVRDGLDVLLPRMVFLDRRRVAGKRKPRGRPPAEPAGVRQRVEPMFPGYLFARLTPGWPESWQRLRDNPWVLRVLGTGDEPVPVPDAAVDLIMEKSLGSGIVVFRNGRPAWKDLAAGTRVEITEEPFRGLVGVLEKPTSGRTRVRVLLQLMGQEVPVEVDAGSVKAVEDDS